MSAAVTEELLHVGLLGALVVLGWMLDRHHKSSSYERDAIRKEVDYLLQRLGVGDSGPHDTKGA